MVIPPELAIPLAGIASGTVVIVSVLKLISRAITRPRATQVLPNEDVARRLERIEQIVETTALEVERLGESNRFVAKLLAENKESARP